MPEINTLDSISPVDGRYRRVTFPLADHFSERALMSARVRVEGEYLIALSYQDGVNVRSLTTDEELMLRGLSELSLEDAQMIKDIEVRGVKEKGIKATNHDVKAVEYFMREKLRNTSLKDVLPWIHFALTSEDVNNISYALMIRSGLEDVVLPAMKEVTYKIEEMATKHSRVPMLARTHGQPASPTTFGKEFRVFSSRLERQLDDLTERNILVKLNGATGNYNAHVAAYPDIDWQLFTEQFFDVLNESSSIDFQTNPVTTQIEPHDNYAEIFHSVMRFNTVLIDFNQDMWRYISDGWIRQKPVEGEVGSSTMPHKVNPIDFENSEGNLGMANSMFQYFATTLPISRLQRHLSDSTIIRNFGSAFAYSLIGYKSAMKGLGKIAVDEQRVFQELENHPEVIAEGFQTILRREGVADAYEQLKEMTRGKSPTLADFRLFASKLDVSSSVKDELYALTPSGYTGLAVRIALE